MPTNEELEGQLKIQQDINKVLAKRAKMFEAQTGYLDGQARIAKELCKALECEGLEDMEERLDNIQKGLKKAGDQADTLAKNTSEAAKQAQKASDNFDKMAAVAAAGALSVPPERDTCRCRLLGRQRRAGEHGGGVRLAACQWRER